MAIIINRVTAEISAELNKRLDDMVDSNSPARLEDGNDDGYWAFMKKGLSAINCSDSRHRMFPEE